MATETRTGMARTTAKRATAPEILARLEKLGKPGTRAIYERHAGRKDVDAFGVSFADIEKIRKEIKRDHELALALWKSGRFEARVIATMVADPAQVTAALADRLIGDVRHAQAGYFVAELVAASPVADAVMRKWMRARSEIVQTAGYAVLGSLFRLKAPPPDDFCASVLETIEREIHDTPNRARYAMNGALIAIGGGSPALRERALAAAKRIGKVEVDHGDTDCKTPDATTYILKMAAREAAKKTPAKKPPRGKKKA